MQRIKVLWHIRIDKNTDRSNFFLHVFFTITQCFKNSRFLFHAGRKVKRFWLVHFRKEYVQDQILSREGDCKQCGTCCNLLYTCPMLTKEKGCLVYGFCRPQVCKIFPIDQRDIDEIKMFGRQCGYWFNNGHPKKVEIGKGV